MRQANEFIGAGCADGQQRGNQTPTFGGYLPAMGSWNFCNGTMRMKQPDDARPGQQDGVVASSIGGAGESQ